MYAHKQSRMERQGNDSESVCCDWKHIEWPVVPMLAWMLDTDHTCVVMIVVVVVIVIIVVIVIVIIVVVVVIIIVVVVVVVVG